MDTIKYYSIPSVPSGLEEAKTRPDKNVWCNTRSIMVDSKHDGLVEGLARFPIIVVRKYQDMVVRTGIGGMRTNQCFRQISCGVIPCIARMPTRILRRAARGYSGGAVAVPLVIINRPAGTATPATGITLKYTWYQRSGYLWRNFAPPRQSTPCST